MAEQAPGFGDTERDHPELGRRELVRELLRGCGAVSAAAEKGGGDGADG